MYKYLKDNIYYSNFYDQLTIEKCRRWENTKYSEDISKLKGKEKKLETIKKEYFEKVVAQFVLNAMKTDYASKKSEVIQRWMKRDKAKDEKLADAKEPQDIRCLSCGSLLENCTSRDLMDNNQDREEVLFMFECEKCGQRRSCWENGKEWEYKPTCIKCKAEVQEEISREDDIITTKYFCSKCGYNETDVMNLNERKKKKIDRNFESNRKKYCISEQEGSEFMGQIEGIKEIVDKWKDKENNKDLYDAIDKIKRLTILELQNLLNPLVEKSGYAKLEFEKPELQKDVILGFNLQDAKSGRSEWDSVHELQKLLRKSLQDTNWRLMSDGVRYRLGYLQGRLRGVEGEKNLLNIVKYNIKFKK